MNNCRGLTTIDHEDLKKAVGLWEEMKLYYNTTNKDAINYAMERFSRLPWYKRFWIKHTTCRWLLFVPLVTVYDYGKDFIMDYKRNAGAYYKDCVKVRNYLSEYTNVYSSAATECKRHSLEKGTHYLNDRQVEFVNIFKDMHK